MTALSACAIPENDQSKFTYQTKEERQAAKLASDVDVAAEVGADDGDSVADLDAAGDVEVDAADGEVATVDACT
ncbi:MAG: hypothetical protein FJ100_23940, partial [Deltaproteobacteria bacterium]|nr:hypothetical protein [Deltaproteobacteria bacterium]